MRRIRSDIQNIRSAKAAIENLQAENATLKAQKDELLEFINRFNEVCATCPPVEFVHYIGALAIESKALLQKHLPKQD